MVWRLVGVLAAAVLLGGAGAGPGVDAAEMRPQVPREAPAGASACTGCHMKGVGVGLLQGRPTEDTMRILEGYRSGQRPATIMGRIVTGFATAELYDLALWFSVQ